MKFENRQESNIQIHSIHLSIQSIYNEYCALQSEKCPTSLTCLQQNQPVHLALDPVPAAAPALHTVHHHTVI